MARTSCPFLNSLYTDTVLFGLFVCNKTNNIPTEAVMDQSVCTVFYTCCLLLTIATLFDIMHFIEKQMYANSKLYTKSMTTVTGHYSWKPLKIVILYNAAHDFNRKRVTRFSPSISTQVTSRF